MPSPVADPPLADLPLAELLERVAGRTPAPGGGSACAVACALSAALIQMAAAFAPAAAGEGAGIGAGAEIGARAAELRAQALELAESERSSYLPVLEALRTPRDEPGREERLAAARSRASEAPLRIAEIGAALGELAAHVGAAGSPHLAGDATAAALLAEAACRAASSLVAINLAGDPGDPRLERAREFSERADQARNRVMATAREPGSR
jgi:formiminotetrahydrofolate cyclodeaminase